MIKIDVSSEDMNILEEGRRKHPHSRVRQRMQVIWLKAQGIGHQEIARVVGICRGTVRLYLLLFQNEGIKGLCRLDFYRPVSELDAHRTVLEKHFNENPPISIPSAMRDIERLTGIKHCRESVRKFLHHLGLKRRKVGHVPAKADAAAQEDFKKRVRTAPR